MSEKLRFELNALERKNLVLSHRLNRIQLREKLYHACAATGLVYLIYRAFGGFS